MAGARKQVGSAGNSGTSALAFGGANPPSTSNLTATEEYSELGTVKVITDS
jgi:hypothetical protein